MTMIVNNSDQTLNLAGVQVGPRELADVNASAKSLREHLFVRSGLVEVSGGKPSQPQKAQKQEPESTEEGSSE